MCFQVKCFRYWPEKGDEQAFSFYDEEYVVKTVSVSLFATHISFYVVTKGVTEFTRFCRRLIAKITWSEPSNFITRREKQVKVEEVAKHSFQSDQCHRCAFRAPATISLPVPWLGGQRVPVGQWNNSYFQLHPKLFG
jgi:hypothetical protein